MSREASRPRCFLYAIHGSVPLPEIAEGLAEHLGRRQSPCRARPTRTAPPGPLAGGFCLTADDHEGEPDVRLATDVVVLVTLPTICSPMRACARVRLLFSLRGDVPVWVLGLRGGRTGSSAQARAALCEEVRRVCGVEARWLGDIPRQGVPGRLGMTAAVAYRLASLLAGGGQMCQRDVTGRRTGGTLPPLARRVGRGLLQRGDTDGC